MTSARALTLCVAVGLFSGCVAATAIATFFPVEGPLSERVPVPTISATATGIAGNTGAVSLTMPDGEACQGRWSSAAATAVTVTSSSLIGTYGAIYGTGVTASPGRGQNPGVAVLTCTDGRTIEMEFVTGAGTANGFGFAKDNRGNVFRVLF